MLQRISIWELKAVKEQGVGVVLAGIVISMIYGIFYAFGGYAFYLSLHINIRLDDYKKFFLVFPLMSLTSTLFISLGDKLLLLYNKINLAVAALITIIGFSFHAISYFYNFYLISIVLILIVSPILGILYTIPFRCSSRYFPTYNNKLNSLFHLAIGVGAAVFTLFLRVSANFENMNLNDFLNKYEIASALRLIGTCCYAAALFVLFHLKYNKDLNTKLLMDYEIAATETNIKTEKQIASSEIQSNVELKVQKPSYLNPVSEVLSVKQALFSKTFLLIFIMSFVLTNGFLVISSYKLLVQRYSSGEDNITTLFACLGFILFGTARYIVRQIIDKIGFKKVFLIIATIQLISFVFLFLHLHTGTTIALCIFIQGLYLNWFNLLVPRVFGYRNAAKIIQIMLITFALVENVTIHILNHYFEISILVKISGSVFALAVVAVACFEDQVQWIVV